MLTRLLSGDLPRSRVLGAVLLLIFVMLLLTPFAVPGVKALNVAAKILVFAVLVASFDLLLGYTGIVSFAHTMFFGIGAYGVAIASSRMGPGWAALGVGIGGALALSFVLAAGIGLFSLRVRAIFFSMITLAFAAAFPDARVAAVGVHRRRGRPDLQDAGTAVAPRSAVRAAGCSGQPSTAASLPTTCCFACALAAVSSRCAHRQLPVRGGACCRRSGRTSSAPRPSLPVVVYRTISSVLSALFATLAGAMLAVCCATTARTPRCPSR